MDKIRLIIKILIFGLLAVVIMIVSVIHYAGVTPIQTDPESVAYLAVSRDGNRYLINHPDDFSTKINPSEEDMRAIIEMFNNNEYCFDRLYLSGKGSYYVVWMYDSDGKLIKCIDISSEDEIQIQNRFYKIVKGSVDKEMINKILENYLPELKGYW